VLIAQVNALLRLRRAESIANLSARQWQTTFDSLTDGVVLLDAERTIVRTNRTFKQMLELTASATEGIPLAQLIAGKFGISFDWFLSKLHEDLPIDLALEKRWFRFRFNTIDSEPQTDTGSILLMTDITDQKKLQETLKLNERLAATGRLAHIIAHEINNPLEAMSNLLYLAERAVKPESEAHGYVQQASSELERISRITRQVLAYHRDSQEPVAIRADEVVESVLGMFRSHIMGNGIVLETRLRCADSVYVHPGELRQVFSNLIANALDAMGPPGGTLRVRCLRTVDTRSGRKGVGFIFSDTGSGIPEHTLPSIFDAFFTTKGMEGSGVGLWLSAEILAKQGGRIRVRTRTSGPHRGTLFAVFLPAHRLPNDCYPVA
jgi:two-component system NtrC family sensor kinase